MSLQVYASHILAKALQEIVPHIEVLGVESEGALFSCEWDSVKPFSREMLPLVEERMRACLKPPEEAVFNEMVAHNAAGLFKAKGQRELAFQLDEWGGELVYVIHLDGYVGIAPYSFATPKKVYIKLVDLSHDEGCLRITGVAAEEDAALKELVKTFSRIEKSRRQNESLIKKYLLDEGIALPPALKFARLLKAIAASGVEIESTQERFSSLKKVLEETGNSEIFTFDGEGDLLLVSKKEPESSLFFNSSLQLFEKTARILGFKSRKVLCHLSPPEGRNGRGWKAAGARLTRMLTEAEVIAQPEETEAGGFGPCIQYLWVDELGRSFRGPCLYVSPESEGEDLQMARELFPEWKRLLRKLIENGSLKLVEAELKREFES